MCHCLFGKVMKLLLQLFFFFLLCKPSFANNLSFEEKIHYIQESGSKCLLNIARRFFKSNNICIVTSGSNNITNTRIAMPTYQLIYDLLMKDQKWSMFSKTTTLSIKNHPYVRLFSNTFKYL